MNILIVDDEKKLGVLLCRTLKEAGYLAEAVETAERAIELLPKGFDVVVTDIRMPGMNGIELLRHVKSEFPGTTVIMMTAHGTIDSAVEAMKAGAYDYILKPFPPEELVMMIGRIAEEMQLHGEIEYRRLKEQERFGEIIGISPTMKRIFELIEKVSPTDATVLLLGETGTGKELVARAIHERSPRAQKSFIAINCAAITETLLESELFGYEKGAFTGADKRKLGMFEVANGGTLFLDEIAEMPLMLQAKLLRVLQEKTIFHLGGTTPIPVDVRIIVATNKDLKRLINERRFREDLYFRISVFPIELPPLRKRKEDIPLLVQNCLNKRSSKAKISKSAMEILMDYDFPGNVRELENIIERALILSCGEEIMPEHLPDLETVSFETSQIQSDTTLDELERKMLISALEKAGGNKTKAAKILGITRRMIYSRLKKYGMG